MYVGMAMGWTRPKDGGLRPRHAWFLLGSKCLEQLANREHKLV